MKKVYAGMDIGSKECAAVVIDSKGKQVDSAVFKTSERNLRAFFSKHPSSSLLVEECEMAAWVRETVKPHVARVTVCDPKRNAWVAKGTNKNDRVDAAKLAELNRLGSYAEVWHTDDADIAGFKVLVKHYDDTSARLAALKCQIKARLRKQGVIARGEAVYGARRHEALCRVENTFARIAIEQDYDLLDYLVEAKAAARKSVIAASRRFPVIGRLRQIPGGRPDPGGSLCGIRGRPAPLQQADSCELLVSGRGKALERRLSHRKGAPVQGGQLSAQGPVAHGLRKVDGDKGS